MKKNMVRDNGQKRFVSSSYISVWNQDIYSGRFLEILILRIRYFPPAAYFQISFEPKSFHLLTRSPNLHRCWGIWRASPGMYNLGRRHLWTLAKPVKAICWFSPVLSKHIPSKIRIIIIIVFFYWPVIIIIVTHQTWVFQAGIWVRAGYAPGPAPKSIIINHNHHLFSPHRNIKIIQITIVAVITVSIIITIIIIIIGTIQRPSFFYWLIFLIAIPFVMIFLFRNKINRL